VSDDKAPVLVKVKKIPPGAHGGAWKVAYADFVTAMMAFFLLLWLLNAVEHEQMTGVADYFSPASLTRAQSGSSGVFGGSSMSADGVGQTAPSIISTPLPMDAKDPGEEQFGGDDEGLLDTGEPTQGDTLATHKPQPHDIDGTLDERRKGIPATTPDDPTAPVAEQVFKGQDNPDAETATRDVTKPADEATEKPKADVMATPAEQVAAARADMEAVRREMAKREEEGFERAEQSLRQAMQQVPELRAMKDSLKVDRVPEGLRIQLLDQERFSMFPSGSAALYDQPRRIIGLVGQVISKLPNAVKITGHTDATPLRRADGYSNWELSMDRANAARRALMAANIPEERLQSVVGLADTEPMFPDQPSSPRNRRISMILLTELTARSGFDVNAAPALMRP
jgi:chemotaxis protein MotB